MPNSPEGSTRPEPRFFMRFALLLFVLWVATGVWSRLHPSAVPNLVRWVPIEKAEETARLTGHPLLYDFSAEWCGPCRSMEREVFADAAGAKLINERFVAVHVVDRQREDGRNSAAVEALHRKYGVESFPLLVAVGHDRGVPHRLSGYLGKIGTMRFLEEALSDTAPPPSGP